MILSELVIMLENIVELSEHRITQKVEFSDDAPAELKEMIS